MSSTEEEVESVRGEDRPYSISLRASNMSTITEEAVGGRGAKEKGSEDSDIPSEACLLSPNPEALVLRPSPNVIAVSATSGEQGTNKGGEGEAATLAETIPSGRE